VLGVLRASLLSRPAAPLALSVGAVAAVAYLVESLLAGDVRAGTTVPVRSAPPEARAVAGEPAPERPSGLVTLESVTVAPGAHPLDRLSSAELARIALDPPDSLGSICIGRPTRGRLLNAVELRSGPGVEVMTDEHNFGTASTVRSLLDAVAELEHRFPGAPDVQVGDISRARGGYLRPHRSHQVGLDVDMGYFYDPPARWYTRATAENLDRKHTWGFLKALIAQGGVEYVFMDRSIQVLIREHAKSIGEDPDWIDALFERPHKKDTLFRHTWGHVTHFHVRFMDPAAEQSGRRLERGLRRAGKI
jgi:murein endopeptidase